MEKANIIKAIVYLLGAIATALLIAFGLQSCKAMRVYSVNAKVVNQDTTTISTVVTESYVAKKKLQQ